MERLQKVMAHAGVASRRKCEELIQQGYVQVNGKLVTELGFKVSATDKIEVNGMSLHKEEPVYYLFNKPNRVISAVSDDKNRRVVTDYFDVKERIYPVGRLDYDTTGALLLTNDGEFAQMMMHPKYHIDKTYVAKLKGIPTDKHVRKLEKGVWIEGKKTSPAQVRVIAIDEEAHTSTVELVIHEGWNHQVKKMFASVGLLVTKLKREKFGTISLDKLPVGQYRALKPYEVDKLKKATHK